MILDHCLNSEHPNCCIAFIKLCQWEWLSKLPFMDRYFSSWSWLHLVQRLRVCWCSQPHTPQDHLGQQPWPGDARGTSGDRMGGRRRPRPTKPEAGFGQRRRREIRDSRAAAAKKSSAEREPDSNPGGERRGVRRWTSWRRAVADFTRATDGDAWDDSPEAIPVRTQKP